MLKANLRRSGTLFILVSFAFTLLHFQRSFALAAAGVGLLCSLSAEFMGPRGRSSSARSFRIAGLLFLIVDLALLYADVSLGWIYLIGVLVFTCLLAARWKSRSVSRGAID